MVAEYFTGTVAAVLSLVGRIVLTAVSKPVDLETLYKKCPPAPSTSCHVPDSGATVICFRHWPAASCPCVGPGRCTASETVRAHGSRGWRNDDRRMTIDSHVNLF